MARELAKLVKAANIDIRNMAMNGGKAGCQWPQTILVSKLRFANKLRCNTIYKKNTRASLHIEVRPLAGTNISRVYRLWMKYSKLVRYNFGGWLPVHNAGIYGVTGPNMNRMGPMCRHFQYGVFGDGPNCKAFDRYFNVPLNGQIPQNWSRKYGNVHFLLLTPFAVKRVISRDVLESWGVDKRAYPKGIKPGTFPTNFAQLIHLISTRHPSRRERANCNMGLRIPDHVNYGDIHDAKATIILRPGTISIPSLGRLVLSKETRIEVRATRKLFSIAIRNPSFKELRIPISRTTVTAKNVNAKSLLIEMPSIPALSAGRRKVNDTRVTVSGLNIPELAIGNLAFGRAPTVSGAKLRLYSGSMTMKKVGGKFTTSLSGHLDMSIKRVEAQNLPVASGFMMGGTLHNVRVHGPARITFDDYSWDVRGGAHAGYKGTKLRLKAKLKGGRVLHKPLKGYHTDLRISDKLVIEELQRLYYRLAAPGTKQGAFFDLALRGFAVHDLAINGQMGLATLGRILFSKLTGTLRVASAHIAVNGSIRKSVLDGISLDVREQSGQRKRCKVHIPRATLIPNLVKISDHGGKRFSIDCLIRTQHGFTHLKTSGR